MKNYFPLDLEKFRLGTFDLIFNSVGTPCKRPMSLWKKKKERKMFACLETRARSEGYMVKIFKTWCPNDSTHGSLALKAYQQNLYLKYYY